jgi:hypothetical protein
MKSDFLAKLESPALRQCLGIFLPLSLENLNTLRNVSRISVKKRSPLFLNIKVLTHRMGRIII